MDSLSFPINPHGGSQPCGAVVKSGRTPLEFEALLLFALPLLLTLQKFVAE
jgi:hypothetical protein